MVVTLVDSSLAIKKIQENGVQNYKVDKEKGPLHRTTRRRAPKEQASGNGEIAQGHAAVWGASFQVFIPGCPLVCVFMIVCKLISSHMSITRLIPVRSFSTKIELSASRRLFSFLSWANCRRRVSTSSVILLFGFGTITIGVGSDRRIFICDWSCFMRSSSLLWAHLMLANSSECRRLSFKFSSSSCLIFSFSISMFVYTAAVKWI